MSTGIRITTRREGQIPIALYPRVSSKKQDVELSISTQLCQMRDRAKHQGRLIVAEYVDKAESGRSSDRPAFQRMMADAQRKPTRQFKHSRAAR